MQFYVGAATVDNMSYENQILRSLENSPILRFVQSLEEFQLMPQKPHFRPLDECEVVSREGWALKHMMTFVNVLKETSKLQVNASVQYERRNTNKKTYYLLWRIIKKTFNIFLFALILGK